MARVHLYGPDITDDGAPPICMCCGEPAEIRVRKTFRWNPGWAYLALLLGLLPFIVVSLLTTWTRNVYTPLCGRHAGYWRYRTVVVVGGLLTLILVAVLLGVAGVNAGGDWVGFAWLAAAVIFLPWLIYAAILSATSIRTTQISASRIVLAGVHPAFAQAVKGQRAEREARDVDSTVRHKNWPHSQRSEFYDD